MAKVKWSPDSKRDLEAIRDYIGRDSQKYAQDWISRLLEKGRLLGEFPGLGRDVPERLPSENYKEIFVGDYRIIYKVENENQVIIISVLHGARLYKNRGQEEHEDS